MVSRGQGDMPRAAASERLLAYLKLIISPYHYVLQAWMIRLVRSADRSSTASNARQLETSLCGW